MNHTSFWKPRAPIRTSANSLAAVKVGQNQQYYCAALLAMPMGLFPCARTHAHTHTDTEAHMPCFAGALGARLRGRISWQCLRLPMLHVSEPTYTVTTQHRQGISPGGDRCSTEFDQGHAHNVNTQTSTHRHNHLPRSSEGISCVAC